MTEEFFYDVGRGGGEVAEWWKGLWRKGLWRNGLFGGVIWKNTAGSESMKEQDLKV